VTGWLIVAAVFAVAFFGIAIAQMSRTTPDGPTCPEPDDEAKFASIVRHFDDGSVALEVTVLAACAALAPATCALAVALP
jgi:hypothetical protein